MTGMTSPNSPRPVFINVPEEHVADSCCCMLKANVIRPVDERDWALGGEL